MFAITLIRRTLIAISMSSPDEASTPRGEVPPSQAIIEAIAAHDPDVVVLTDALQDHIETDALPGESLHVDPRTVADVGESFVRIAASLPGVEQARGTALRRAFHEELTAIRDAVPPPGADRPVVYCEEWSDPPMAGGNWVPEIVRAAGGAYPFVDPGERSREVDPADVSAADPDHVVVHVCGHGDRVDPETVESRDWVDAPVSVIDDSLLNQPSPALLDGVERLARLLHPEAFSAASDDDRT
jgi:iron complex transport system substrate-binding protein